MLKDQQLFEINVNNSLQCLDEYANLFCNVMRITPRHIIVNETTKIIEIAQVNTYQKIMLQPKERK